MSHTAARVTLRRHGRGLIETAVATHNAVVRDGFFASAVQSHDSAAVLIDVFRGQRVRRRG